jgi:hypothetical protein
MQDLWLQRYLCTNVTFEPYIMPFIDRWPFNRGIEQCIAELFDQHIQLL